jgi:hypothetical protein
VSVERGVSVEGTAQAGRQPVPTPAGIDLPEGLPGCLRQWIVGGASGAMSALGTGTAADWVVCCGTFNLGVTEAEMWGVIREALRVARMGVCFNLLVANDDETAGDEHEVAHWKSCGYSTYEPAYIVGKV